MIEKKERFEILLEDIQSNVKSIAEGQNILQRQINGLKQDFVALDKKYDVTTKILSSEIKDVKTEVNGMKTEVNGMKTEVNGMKTEVVGLGQKIDSVDRKLDKHLLVPHAV